MVWDETFPKRGGNASIFVCDSSDVSNCSRSRTTVWFMSRAIAILSFSGDRGAKIERDMVQLTAPAVLTE
jgi:hypothetical protein